MAEKNKKTNEEIIAEIAKRAVLSIEGVGSLSNNQVNFNLRSREIEKGIWLSFNDNKLNFDVYLNVVYGSKIPQIAFNVQECFKKAIERLTTLEVDKVNIHVQGIDFN